MVGIWSIIEGIAKEVRTRFEGAVQKKYCGNKNGVVRKNDYFVDTGYMKYNTIHPNMNELPLVNHTHSKQIFRYLIDIDLRSELAFHKQHRLYKSYLQS